uniref:Uncharacterized protein n=1 Tax=Caldimicrobium thiodismutans TaxID=1653476 RepID=A0A832GRX1_9BACT
MIPISAMRDTIKKEYRKEFIIWLSALIMFFIGIAFVVREVKKFFVIREIRKNVESDYFALQAKVVKVKERLVSIDWQRDFTKVTADVNLMVDLRDIGKGVREIKALSSSDDTYLVIKEMVYKQEKEKEVDPRLQIIGEIWIFK